MSAYAIVGAGCAGLSLAVHLIEAGFREPLHLYERRHHYEDDRTWCAFRVDAHRFAGCVSKRWHRVAVVAGKKQATAELYEHPYEHIASKDFYREALSVLEAAENVELHLGVDAEALPGAKVRTAEGVKPFAHVFDSRFSTEALPDGLWQCFSGVVVETEQPRFDARCATLMDFDVGAPGPDALQFRYVLPFDSHHALIEDTHFARQRIQAGSSLGSWLEALGPHQVMRRESGALPMSVGVGAHHRDGVTPIGLAAGSAKPSSGYAFDFIQRHCRALVDDPTAPMPRAKLAVILDQILLDEMTKNPKLGAKLFRRMFQRNEGDRIARFMMEGASASDISALMATVPSLRLVSGGMLWPYRRLRGHL
ncbi:MAG: lycopene beta-cyclase [Polyangiales bacterium]